MIICGAVRPYLGWSLDGMCVIKRLAQPRLAKESHEPQAEHVKRCQPGGDDSNCPESSTVFAIEHLPQNLIFAEETGQGREAGDGKRGNGHHPESYRDLSPKPAHAPH